MDNFNFEEMGMRIKKCRIECGMTQEELGNELHYTRQMISNIEKGKSEPTISDIKKMSMTFGCDVGYIIGEYNERTRQTTDIVAETGLDGKAVELLRTAKNERYWFVTKALNEMLKYDNLRLLDLIGQFLMMAEHESVELSDGEKIDKGVLYSRKIEQELVKLRSQIQQRKG